MFYCVPDLFSDLSGVAAAEKPQYTDSYGVVHPQPVLHSYNPAYVPRAVKFGAFFQIVGRVL